MMRFDGNNYEDLREGMRLSSLDVIVSDELHQQFQSCFSIEPLTSESGVAPAVSAGEVPSPVLIASFTAMKQVLKWPTGVLHARESIVSKQPIRCGESLRIETCIKKRFQKGDKKFMVLAIDVYKKSDQTPAMTIERTMVWP